MLVISQENGARKRTVQHPVHTCSQTTSAMQKMDLSVTVDEAQVFWKTDDYVRMSRCYMSWRRGSSVGL